MKLISLLIGLLLIIYLMSKQLAPPAVSVTDNSLQQEGITLPQVPVSPKDLKKFETDMNNFVQESALKRDAALEEALKK